jgi:Fe-S-cluster containining protein
MNSISSEICQKNCYGIKDHSSACCKIQDRNWQLGPVRDTETFLSNYRKKFPGVNVEFDDIFITFEEGKKLSNKGAWQNPNNYPALRVKDNKDKSCIFFNDTLQHCSVYDIRPIMCKNYKCDFLKSCLNEKI